MHQWENYIPLALLFVTAICDTPEADVDVCALYGTLCILLISRFGGSSLTDGVLFAWDVDADADICGAGKNSGVMFAGIIGCTFAIENVCN